MIKINEGHISKKIGKTRRNTSWNKGKRGLRHHSSEIILRENQLLENLERLRQGGKGQGSHLFNVGVVREIICINIVLTEVKK
jgi:hypothetical protein